MTEKKLTPEMVKKIELSLEERKQKQDRRKTNGQFQGQDRRTGKDRRDKSPD